MELPTSETRSERIEGMAADSSSRVNFDQEKATLSMLGMTLVEVELEEENRSKLYAQQGVAVLVVGPDSEAFRCGVISGDIVAEINSAKIRSFKDLKKVLRLHDPRDPMFVFLMNRGVWRLINLSFIRGVP